MPSDEHDRLRQWEHDGFFILRRLVRPARMMELAEACDHVLRQVRRASSEQGHSTTYVSGLLAPAYFAERPEVLERLSNFMSSREVLTVIHGLGRPGEGLPNLRDTHYFHEPTARDSDGSWHRDGGRLAVDDTDAACSRPTLLRFRIAFAHDDHLEYVPGSHRRADTPEERGAIRGMLRTVSLGSAPVRIYLEPGDVCVFNTWGIHRARYRRDRIRRTLDLLFGFGPRRRVDYGSLLELVTQR